MNHCIVESSPRKREHPRPIRRSAHFTYLSLATLLGGSLLARAELLAAQSSAAAHSSPPAPKAAATPAGRSFTLTGLTSPATVSESIFVNATGVAADANVAYYMDGVLAASATDFPYWLGGGSASSPNGFSTNYLSPGAHTLTAVATLANGTTASSNAVTLNVIPSINSQFSSMLAPYANQVSAQHTSVSTMLANTSTAGASISSSEIAVRHAVLAMYANWGIDPSLDYANDQSSILSGLAPKTWQPPASTKPAAPYSMALSPDAPYYHAIPAQWPRVQLPSGYFNLLQLNTNNGGDGIGFGESVANASSPVLTATSEWYGDASTLVAFPYRMQSNWTAALPTTTAGDMHVIFIDPLSDTFVSSYKTSLNTHTGGPDGLYITTPTSFNSLGDSGGTFASHSAELPVMIQPGEATNANKPIGHAISGSVARTWAARVYPAAARDTGILTSTNSCTGSGKTNNGLVPYDAVLQLDPTIDLTKLTLTLPARRILEAIQTYGYYAVDFGCTDIDIYTAIPESELDPYGGLYGNANGSGVQGEVQKVLLANKLYVVAPLTKKE